MCLIFSMFSPASKKSKDFVVWLDPNGPSQDVKQNPESWILNQQFESSFVTFLMLCAGQQNQAQSSGPDYSKAWEEFYKKQSKKTSALIFSSTVSRRDSHRSCFCVFSSSGRSRISAELSTGLHRRLGGVLQTARGVLQPGTDAGSRPPGKHAHVTARVTHDTFDYRMTHY